MNILLGLLGYILIGCSVACICRTFDRNIVPVFELYEWDKEDPLFMLWAVIVWPVTIITGALYLVLLGFMYPARGLMKLCDFNKLMFLKLWSKITAKEKANDVGMSDRWM